MTTKEVKQWLWRARWIEQEINSLIGTYTNEYNRLTTINAQLSGVSVSGTKEPHKFDRLVELGDTVRSRVVELHKVKAEVIETLSKIDDFRYREILKRYYVDGESLEWIAVDMKYSYRHVKRLRYEAINALKMVLECPPEEVI